MKNIMLWARRYVTVYGIIMLCTFFMCLLFNPTSRLPVVSFFGRIKQNNCNCLRFTGMTEMFYTFQNGSIVIYWKNKDSPRRMTVFPANRTILLRQATMVFRQWATEDISMIDGIIDFLWEVCR